MQHRDRQPDGSLNFESLYDNGAVWDALIATEKGIKNIFPKVILANQAPADAIHAGNT